MVLGLYSYTYIYILIRPRYTNDFFLRPLDEEAVALCQDHQHLLEKRTAKLHLYVSYTCTCMSNHRNFARAILVHRQTRQAGSEGPEIVHVEIRCRSIWDKGLRKNVQMIHIYIYVLIILYYIILIIYLFIIIFINYI